ncbi:MAG: pilus assembly protein PilM [Verrucomicrobia bacterium]|nr:pilus assembly protein PilM [Verrucomicrobiota bacterium]
MALPFLGTRTRSRDQITAVDLGTHTFKAVHIQQKGGKFSLTNYAIQDSPGLNGPLTPQSLGDALAKVLQPMGARSKQVALALGSSEAILRHAELPLVAPSDMRTMLKYNAKNYLQQDLSDHVFDCHILPPRPGAKLELKPGQKCRVLVGGVPTRLIDDILAGAKLAGVIPEVVVPGLVGPVNAFESAQPERFAESTVALVDIGFRNSSITILNKGELMLTRVVGIGGDRLTSGVAETLGIGYAEAEGIKLGLPQEVESTIVSLLSPLARELRASIDYFEHQQDCPVNEVFVSGGSSNSEYIVQFVQTELVVPCVTWNPAAFLTLNLPAQKLSELEQTAPRLTTAIGAALAAL